LHGELLRHLDAVDDLVIDFGDDLLAFGDALNDGDLAVGEKIVAKVPPGMSDGMKVTE
jgi:hypothetical protein